IARTQNTLIPNPRVQIMQYPNFLLELCQFLQKPYSPFLDAMWVVLLYLCLRLLYAKHFPLFTP
ncbi:hypothetical protein, partial [Helicobacter bizzozeronii]|uniref:hypothetical protein n=1 Tax=Helicobacter bizzozeronii TaxID=56877 RepID=UPI001F45F26A